MPEADSTSGTHESICTNAKGVHVRKMTEQQWRAYVTLGTRTDEHAARNGGPGNLRVRGHIDKVMAFDGIAG